MAGTLTAANAILQITIPGLYSSPQQLQQFSTDDVTEIAEIRTIETQMGVDGVLAAGFVYVPFEQTITLQANSPSNDIFDNWWVQQQQIGDAIGAGGILTLPSIGKKYIFINGYLSQYPTFAGVKKILQARRYGIVWNKIFPAPASGSPIT